MDKNKVPANISHVVLVHAGSYNDFLQKLTSQYPDLKIRFVKRLAIHYYILQLEDCSEPGKEIEKEKIYKLPIMAMREEFSSYIFFKTIKAYNNVLKRMCHADDNKDASFVLSQHMMTPFEKSRILHLDKAESLTIKTLTAANEDCITTYYKPEDINSYNTLNKLFSLDKVKVNNEDKDFTSIAKDMTWVIGIH